MLCNDMNETLHSNVSSALREIADAWDSAEDLCRKASSALRELSYASLSASECIAAFNKVGYSALELCDSLEKSTGKPREECINDTLSLLMTGK